MESQANGKLTPLSLAQSVPKLAAIIKLCSAHFAAVAGGRSHTGLI